MKNIYEVFFEHLLQHRINKDKTTKPIEFNGICPYCGSTMYEVFDKENQKS